eukprot:12935906-Prorocentrum_lima.AAC.1
MANGTVNAPVSAPLYNMWNLCRSFLVLRVWQMVLLMCLSKLLFTTCGAFAARSLCHVYAIWD